MIEHHVRNDGRDFVFHSVKTLTIVILTTRFCATQICTTLQINPLQTFRRAWSCLRSCRRTRTCWCSSVGVRVMKTITTYPTRPWIFESSYRIWCYPTSTRDREIQTSQCRTLTIRHTVLSHPIRPVRSRRMLR